MKISQKQRVMHMAHIIYKARLMRQILHGVNYSWSTAVTDAWRMQEVRNAMSTGIVELYYTKKDGTDVMRHGTLSPALIPSMAAPKGIQDKLIEDGAAEPVWGVVSYYDLDMHGWRSFQIESLRKASPAVDISTPVYKSLGKRLY